MTPLFKKLNFKDHSTILSVNHPDSFSAELEQMAAMTEIRTDANRLDVVEFAIAFATAQAEVDRYTRQVAPKLAEDAVFWFCYPKQSSRRYTCDFNRDTGWAVMGEYGLEPVRQVAIDEDWSALRFRQVDKIKTLTRSKERALSSEGKKRLTKRN
jgi:hypothetical protein